ncbi:MAG: arylsulfatase A-like enzyme [Saprospiraceae bacterium]|jgi:arylsulfatase A-like enzyme
MKSISLFNCFVLSRIVLFSCNQNDNGKRNANAEDRPNIVFMLADDLGWSEVGFNNDSKKHTPNIDQLKEEGLSLTQFYVHAVCAPSRTVFLTCRYPFRNWTDWRSEDFGKPSYLNMLGMQLEKNKEGQETRRIHALASDEKTIAEALQEQGYATAIMGKWGCGEWLLKHLPMQQGFMHQYGHYGWGLDYTNYTIPHNAPARFAVYDWHRNQEPLNEQEYATDLIANEVVHQLSKHKDEYGNDPFFYYVPFNAIHGPLEEIPRYVDKVGKRNAAIKCLDDAVGRTVGAIDQYGFGENILIVFTNDNGAIRDTMNAPYRGTKNTNYEGGVRAPCIVYWPSKVASGKEHNGLMRITDFYPTLIHMAGGTIAQTLPIDGIEMTSIIVKGEKSQREEIIYEGSNSVRPPAIRQGDYKLIGEELYNIIEDPNEQVNLATISPDIAISLKVRIDEVGNERPPLPDMRLLMTP